MARGTFDYTDAVLGTTAALVHTVGSSVEANMMVQICNLTAVDVTVSLWILPSGVSAVANQYAWLLQYPLTAREPRYALENIWVPPGAQIWAGCSAATSASIHVTGVARGTA